MNSSPRPADDAKDDVGVPDRRERGTSESLLPGLKPLDEYGRVTDRTAVHRWVARYELAWRTSGTDGLSALFTADATYVQSPYEEPVVGIHAINKMWADERDGPDEVFTLSTEIVAVEGDTAVVRVEVQYGEPIRQEYRDLWIIRFDADGRCARFEEWPFWPGHPYSARDDTGPASTASE